MTVVFVGMSRVFIFSIVSDLQLIARLTYLISAFSRGSLSHLGLYDAIYLNLVLVFCLLSLRVETWIIMRISYYFFLLSR